MNTCYYGVKCVNSDAVHRVSENFEGQPGYVGQPPDDFRKEPYMFSECEYCKGHSYTKKNLDVFFISTPS